MSIIVQAGHSSSKSKMLMQTLYEKGLEKPLDSYTHKMTAQQITETLSKVLSRKNISSTSEKLAENIMVDLLLANLDYRDWGWESEKNLTALQYWGQIESDVRFILVFDHPYNILKELSDKKLTVDIIDQVMSEWVDYHKVMLSFVEGNSDKFILIEGTAALNNANALSKQLKGITNTLQLKSGWQLLINNNGKSISSLNVHDESDKIVKLLAMEILLKYPEVTNLFDVLLDKASIKTNNVTYRSRSSNINDLISSLNYLNYNKNNSEYKKYKTENNLLEKEIEKLVCDKNLIEKKYYDNEKLLKNYKNNESILILNQERSKNNCDEINMLKKENELLVRSLNNAQEKLEKFCIGNQELVSNPVNLIATGSKKVIQPSYYNVSDRIKQDLPYRLGSTLVKSKSIKSTFLLPITLYSEYLVYKNVENKLVNLPPLSSQSDILEAERLKKHLSYRIGKILVDGATNPRELIKAPKKIGKEFYDFRKKK